MKDIDILFQNILEYVYSILWNKKVDGRIYDSERPYGTLWKMGCQFIEKGFSKEAMQIALENEKIKIIRNREMSDEELLEVIVMERIIFLIYLGEFCKIAPIVQAFASQELMAKYSFILNQLYQMDDHMRLAKRETIYLKSDILEKNIKKED